MSPHATTADEKIASLEKALAEREHALALRDETIAVRNARIAELEQLVAYLHRRPYCPSTDKYEGMTPLFNEAEAEQTPDEPAPVKDRTKSPRPEGLSRPGRRPLPSELPRTVIRHEIPEAQRSCTCCQGPLHEIGCDVSEQLEIIPAALTVLRHERVTYGCRACEAAPVTASMPKQPVPKSMASPATLAHVAVAKYADALPLYRQEAMWARLGIALDRGTLANWMVKAGQLVEPIINLLREDILRDGVVHCDESTVQVLKAKKPTSPGYMWVLSRAGPGPAAHVFTYDPSRSGRVAQRLLADFSGVVVTDGFEGYKALELRGLTRAGCWAHVRRKFLDAIKIEGQETRASVAHRMMTLIRRLYLVERATKNSTPDDRLDERRRVSARIIAMIDRLVDETLLVVPPKTPTGKALHYLKHEWRGLTVFLRDGRVPIDNNRVENAIRPFTLGRKNWLFSLSVAGAEASANLYTLVETAKANGLDPYSYLTRVFTALPNAVSLEDVQQLLPYPA